MQIFKANRQWASRPDDERFASLQDLYAATRAYADVAGEKTVPCADLRVEAVGDDVQLTGRQGVPARLTHWSFGQLSMRVGAPASYLRDLPASLAAQNLNYGLAHRVEQAREEQASLLFHQNGGLLLRAITSEQYSRIWNWEIAERLLEMESFGWKPTGSFGAVAADKRDADLYASDHDMFAFVFNPSSVVEEDGSSDPLYKGVIVENSEVGASALKMTRFLFRTRCCNHIIWGASQVQELRLRHVGTVREKFQVYQAKLRQYAEESVSDVEAKIKLAKSRLIAATKEEVLDALFGRQRQIGLSRKALETSYNAVQEEQDGDPRSVWGFVQGITRFSQSVPYADKRTELDRAAGRLMEVVF